jgi:Uma2 family endonuclease
MGWQEETRVLEPETHVMVRAPDETTRQWLLETLLAPVARRKMTYEEFLAWADEDTLAEWVDGEVVMYSPASGRHQALAGFLEKVMGTYVDQRGAAMLLSAPFQVKLEHGREPDLLFVAGEHLDRLKDTCLDGPADLVVEIVSPESIGRDRGDKFYEYEQAGIPEYWLLDSERRWAEFYQLAAGRYRPAFSGEAGEYHSKVLPGFWLRVEWLWQDPLPTPLHALAEIVGLDPAVLAAFEQAVEQVGQAG